MVYGIDSRSRQDRIVVDRTQSETPNAPAEDKTPGSRALTPEAQRALAEAEERRRQRAADAVGAPRELGGQAGPDPARYGDWEKGGIASDF